MFGAEHQRLTRDDELRLGRLAREGDREARQRLAMSVAPLVLKLCSKYAGRGVDTDDLFGEGMVGVMRAIGAYQPERAKWSTYAAYWVHKHLIQATSRVRGPFVLNHHAADCYSRWSRAKEAIQAEQQDGRPPDREQIRKRCGLSGWRLDMALASDPDSWEQDRFYHPAAPAEEEDDGRPGTGLRRLADRAGLTGRELAVIEARYVGEERSMPEVAFMLGLKASTARRYYDNAVKKLRRVGRAALVAG